MTRVSISAGSSAAAEGAAAVAANGGNAVDAALAAAIVSMTTDIAIVSPGSGGFVSVWEPGGEPVVIDGYMTVPGLGLPHAPDSYGHVAEFDYGGPTRTLVGCGAVATPGIFAALGVASERFGSASWAELCAPATRFAAEGVPLSRAADQYLTGARGPIFGWDPQSRAAMHHQDGRPIRAGENQRIPGLAASLEQIAREGPRAMHDGDLARRLSDSVRSRGGWITPEDLSRYEALVREPLRVRFGEWDVALNPTPAVGGATLGAMLLALDRRPLQGWSATETQRVVEIQRAALTYRADELLPAVDRASAAARMLDLARERGAAGLTSPSTTHVSAVDADGLACAITLSFGYGSGAMVEGTGIWLNNGLGELELAGPTMPRPGERLASNMAPTIARRDDGAVLSIGSPGASRITTAILQVLANALQLGMPLQDAIAHPRLHVVETGDDPLVATEPGLPDAAFEGLRRREFERLDMHFGGVQAVWREPGGRLLAAADPRRGGACAQIPPA